MQDKKLSRISIFFLIWHSGYANGDKLLDGSDNSCLYFPSMGEFDKSIKKHILTMSLPQPFFCVPGIKTGGLLPVWVTVLSRGMGDFCLFFSPLKSSLGVEASNSQPICTCFLHHVVHGVGIKPGHTVPTAHTTPVDRILSTGRYLRAHLFS